IASGAEADQIGSDLQRAGNLFVDDAVEQATADREIGIGDIRAAHSRLREHESQTVGPTAVAVLPMRIGIHQPLAERVSDSDVGGDGLEHQGSFPLFGGSPRLYSGADTNHLSRDCDNGRQRTAAAGRPDRSNRRARRPSRRIRPSRLVGPAAGRGEGRRGNPVETSRGVDSSAQPVVVADHLARSTMYRSVPVPAPTDLVITNARIVPVADANGNRAEAIESGSLIVRD